MQDPAGSFAVTAAGARPAISGRTLFEVANERKVFSEQEVAAVVRRAIELQEQANLESYTPGVTDTELQRIAAELGIEAKYLQLAISESHTTESKKGPLHLTEEFERVVDVELDPEDYDILLKHLRPTNNRGSFQQVGRTLSGQAWTGCSMARVEVTSKKGRTRINVRSNALFAWLTTIHPATLGSIMLLGMMGERGLIWLALAIAAVVWLVAGLAFTTLLKKGHKAARRLTEKLAESVAESAPSLRDNLAKPTTPETQITQDSEAKA
jgi:hypothetical protein